MNKKVESKVKVTLIPGDGIGPEITAVTQSLIEAVNAPIEWELAEAGATVFRKGITSGVPTATIESIERTRLVLKGPLETPVGYGEKSANVTLRKVFETFGNIRPIREIKGVPTPFSGRGIDLIVVRENVEDLYAGIEHMQTPTVAQCLKIMSRKGCENIVRLAFEVARAEGKTKVHCATKANIMKLTEGLMKRTFEEVAAEYPDIKAQHIIIDNCAHQLVRQPEQFEVIVTSNMNGDILSDLTSGLIGGLGFAPSANIGQQVAIFEAVHGSAPSIAGKNLANPSAHIMSAVLLLRHLGMFDQAELIEQALLYTWETEKAATSDVVSEGNAVSTSVFGEIVKANLGRKPLHSPPGQHKPVELKRVFDSKPEVKEQIDTGVDIFIQSDLPLASLGESLENLCHESPFRLKMISNRGTKVFPISASRTELVDHFRCRFVVRDQGQPCEDQAILELLKKIGAIHRWMHIEKLCMIDGKAGYTKAQGED